ncbi:MAG: hypothetical protein M1469_00560 [Bacteroidetes bacterium]|nr:hypothetical protein [Bacteroidota bacterium]
MSQQTVKRFLGDLVIDPNLQMQFVSNPDSVLSKYNLTAAEKANLRVLDVKKLSDMKIKDLGGVMWGAIGGSAVASLPASKVARGGRIR